MRVGSVGPEACSVSMRVQGEGRICEAGKHVRSAPHSGPSVEVGCWIHGFRL